MILPNWHPVFVHFTVALFTTAVGFYILSYLINLLKISSSLGSEFEIVARWCLWMAGIIVIPTVVAGLYAYNTVRHDTSSHLAMTDHRNWALFTAAAILLVVLWSCWRDYKGRAISLIFLIVLFFIQGLLTVTAWKGAELVFRYGLGVLSIPQSQEVGHPQNTDTRKFILKDQDKKMKKKDEYNHVH